MFFNILTRDDIFISYSRRDGAAYAAGLADELTAKRLSCFIDKLGTEPDKDLPASLRRTIRNCTLFVVVGTEGAAASEFVAKEIEEFKKTRRTIVPVDFGGAVGRSRWYGLIPGLAAEPEDNPDARRAGDPSDNVVKRIEKSFNYTRRNQRMMRVLVAALAVFFVLTAASGVAAYVAASKIKEASELSGAAERASATAREKTRIADEAAARADAQTKRAEGATQRADEAARLAAAAERKTAQAVALEQRARALADQQQKRADEQQKRADEQTARAEYQLKRGTNLVYTSNMFVAQQSFEQGRAEYGQQLLESYLPRLVEKADDPAAPDLRGFEWRYLWRVSRERYEPDPDFLRPTTVAFSPDGRWLAADDGGGLHLWDTSRYRSTDGVATVAGRLGITNRRSPQELKGTFSALAFSPDSKLLAAGTAGGGLQLFEVAVAEEFSRPEDFGGRRRRRLRFTGRQLPLESAPRPVAVTSLAFSHDGKTLAAGFEVGPPVFFDVTTLKPKGQPGVPPEAHAFALAYSPDGRWLALGHGGSVTLLDTTGSGAPLALDWGAATIRSLAFSPDSRLLAATSFGGKAGLWETASRKPVGQALGLDDGQAAALAFSRDGRMIATAGPEGDTAKVWDTATFKKIMTLAFDERRESGSRPRRRRRPGDLLPGLSGPGLAFSPDSASLAGWNTWQPLVLWNTSPNPAELEAGVNLEGASYSPDGKVIVTADGDGTLSVWDARTRTRARHLQALELDEAEAGRGLSHAVFAFSHDGLTLAVGSRDGRAVTLLETNSYTELFTFQAGESSEESEGIVTALAFSPDGSRLAVGLGQVTNLYDATRLRGPTTPLPLARLTDTTPSDVLTVDDPSDVRSLVFLRGGQVLATCSTYTVRLWDVKAHALRWKFPFSWSHEGALGALALSPDGRQLAVSTTWWLRLYDVELLLAGDARTYLDLRGPGSVAGKAAFSPDGQTLAGGMTNGSVKLWNTVAGQELITLTGHTGEVKGVTFSPDGRTLAAVGGSAPKLWFAATDEEVRRQPTAERPGE